MKRKPARESFVFSSMLNNKLNGSRLDSVNFLTSAAITMRSTIFTMTFSMMMMTWSCEELNRQREQQQQQHQQQQQEYHNFSIMQNVIDSDMPLPLQNAIAACCSIIHEYFVPNANSFMLSMNVREKHLKWHMRDLLNNVLLNLSMIKVEIENIHLQRRRSFNRKYNLIVVDSVEALRELDPAKLTSDYDMQETYMLYLMHASRFSNDILTLIHELFTYFWENSIINVSLMKNNNSTMEFFTYYPFDNHLQCKMPIVRKINSYAGGWSTTIGSVQEWSIFPEKIYDLNKCPLTVAVWDTPPYLSYIKNDEGVYDIDYFEAKLLHVLAEKLNFSLDLREPPNNEQRGKVQANGTLTGAMKMLYDRVADLSLGSFRYTLERSEVLTGALPYYQTYQIYGVLKRAQLYTSLEILVYAFDERTWIALYLSIQFTLILAFVIQKSYDKSLFVRFIMGLPRIKTPLTNIISIFLGQAITHKPQTNLTRFMIISWHIFGLLMRTAYQSLLFQLLKTNLYHQPPQSLADLIAHKCTLVMTEGTYDSVKTVPGIEQGQIELIILKSNSEQNTYFYIEYESHDNCLVGVSPKDYLTFHVIEEQKRGIFYRLPENIFTQHITMYFTKHSYLINRFNELFMNLRGMGLIDFWASISLDTRYLYDTPTKTFTPIGLNNIKGVFVIYLVLALVAISTFILELLFFKICQMLYGPKYEFVE